MPLDIRRAAREVIGASSSPRSVVMRPIRLLVLALPAFAATATAADAQERRAITFEKFPAVRGLYGLRLPPDGARAPCAVRETNLAANEVQGCPEKHAGRPRA
jgi:hypothetical protein